MPKVSEQHLEARQREILEAAWRCFGRQGVHPTTMRDICQEAGLSIGAVYQYFDSKEALIRAVAREGRRAASGRVVPVEEPESPLEGLLESMTPFLECLADPDSQPSMRAEIAVLAEALTDDAVRAVVMENYDHLLRLLAALAGAAQERGEIDDDLAPQSVGRVLVGLLQGLELQKALDPELDVESFNRVVKALFLGTFRR